jgi:hypothetical protein
VRVLLDENLPLEFAAEIHGHEVSTVRGRGWAGLKNGALMKQAAAVCDVFVTMDRNIQHQQHVSRLPFGVILLAAASNRMLHLIPLVANLQTAIAESKPGQFRRVGV